MSNKNKIVSQSNIKTYYHATSEYAFDHILKDGKIKPGIDGIVYLADSKENALKFICFRLVNEPIYIFEVKLNENEVEEAFDHSYKFFECKSYGYNKDIFMNNITNVWKYPPTNITNKFKNDYTIQGE